MISSNRIGAMGTLLVVAGEDPSPYGLYPPKEIKGDWTIASESAEKDAVVKMRNWWATVSAK